MLTLQQVLKMEQDLIACEAQCDYNCLDDPPWNHIEGCLGDLGLLLVDWRRLYYEERQHALKELDND